MLRFQPRRAQRATAPDGTTGPVERRQYSDTPRRSVFQLARTFGFPLADNVEPLTIENLQTRTAPAPHTSATAQYISLKCIIAGASG